MIDPDHTLSIRRQAASLGLARSSVYYRAVSLSEHDDQLMRLIDELHLEYPFMGSRQLRTQLKQRGHEIGRRHVRRLMQRMGIEALYRRPRTTKPAPGHRIYPYLLRNLHIDRPNQVWALDITYLPMKRGFVYFVAVMDWATRRVLSWRLSNTMTADFCVDALEEAIATYGAPEIVNTDQGSQFTSTEFVSVVQASGAKVSMDGKGAWRDNVFIERFWRTLKYEEVYLRGYANVSEARSSLDRYVTFYNGVRCHSSLGSRTPNQMYFQTQALAA